DGYRALGIKQDSDTHLYSRNGKDFDALFPDIVKDLGRLRGMKSFIVDGEIVAVDEKGQHSFSLLQNIRRNGAIVEFFIFDLLHLDGKDLTNLPLQRRREGRSWLCGVIR